MTQYLSTIVLSLLPLITFSQKFDLGETYAIIIGVSEYQDGEIPNLNFADKDANAFAEYLASPAGGAIPEDNLILLTNEKATLARIGVEIGWLWEVCKEGDNIILFFSGHGDVETQSPSQPGYLLPWDARSKIYPYGGAFSLTDLNLAIETFTSKKAKVTIISDACRSGKLAGSKVNGAQRTTASLAQEFENVIKILSCQPNEYSREGSQWGGGHGVFSYHLIDGLKGLADLDNDLAVNLFEIGRYLEDNVSREVAPLQQMPMVVGNRKERVAKVDQGILEDLKQQKAKEIPQIANLDSRLGKDWFVQEGDSTLQITYTLFENALNEKRFLEPTDSCADYYYQQLMEASIIPTKKSKITRDYAVALQDDAQQVLNHLLASNAQEITQSRIIKVQKYKNHPRYIARSAELLGEKHYMYDNLKARQYFFEGLLMWLGNPLSKDKDFGQAIIDKYKLSLELEGYAPHVHFYMQLCFSGVLEEPDSALQHCLLATSQIENWTLPYAYMAFDYSCHFDEPLKAKKLLTNAPAIDSQDVFLLMSYGGVHTCMGEYKIAEQYYESVIHLDSSNATAWLNLGLIFNEIEDYPKAITSFQKSIEINPNQYLAFYGLGVTYDINSDFPNAEKMYLKSIEFHDKFMQGRVDLGYLYLYAEQFDKTEKLFKEVLELYPEDSDAYYHLACWASKTENLEDSLFYLEQCFEKGEEDIKYIMEDSDLEFVKKSKGFLKLKEKYFFDKK